MIRDPRVVRPLRLILRALRPPPGRHRIGLALCYGILCHLVFACAVAAMSVVMFHGMNASLGAVSWPWAPLANGVLLLQFPLLHSWLLTRRGRAVLARLVPGDHSGTLSTTSYAIIASVQLLLLFALWTPTGIIWWRAEGLSFLLLCTMYGASWLFLMKASFDAGIEVQSGALGWMSLLAGKRPVYPGMPVRGLFRYIRHPIYLAFTLTLWTVPVWTPDQLILALVFSTYCLLAPCLKERRFSRHYGERFERYRASVPYFLPAFGRVTRRFDGRRTNQNAHHNLKTPEEDCM
ncbi:isoprenylcysteine carboxylmethyltransferase family protein [Roseibium sp.]|uniref:methyltransferase family protein n=1 Tax=Roseibium sp. TaxID=1936156 RepID=UPI0025F7C743|nr:isoprenylcysteine carboxylmethyltransferase family protein [Roseibium sp.]